MKKTFRLLVVFTAVVTANLAAQEAITKITVEDFVKAFKENKLKAERDFIGKTIELTGKAGNIDKSLVLKKPKIEFIVEKIPVLGITKYGIDCYFGKEDGEALLDLKTGQKVTVTGTVKSPDKLVNCKIRGKGK